MCLALKSESSLSSKVPISTPLMIILPALAESIAPIRLSSVLFPEPDFPTIKVKLLAFTEKVTSFSASISLSPKNSFFLYG